MTGLNAYLQVVDISNLFAFSLTPIEVARSSLEAQSRVAQYMVLWHAHCFGCTCHIYKQGAKEGDVRPYMVHQYMDILYNCSASVAKLPSNATTDMRNERY